MWKKILVALCVILAAHQAAKAADPTAVLWQVNATSGNLERVGEGKIGFTNPKRRHPDSGFIYASVWIGRVEKEGYIKPQGGKVPLRVVATNWVSPAVVKTVVVVPPVYRQYRYYHEDHYHSHTHYHPTTVVSAPKPRGCGCGCGGRTHRSRYWYSNWYYSSYYNYALR